MDGYLFTVLVTAYGYVYAPAALANYLYQYYMLSVDIYLLHMIFGIFCKVQQYFVDIL